ncbi:glutathione S-transferase family protein [Vibrio salinus]|uniref:glutathione S-transferase family protein n=1 Tax=Vibrio salinus TaxID=2899784 RepID=UPI001E40B984|nr:glutathione S-transferase [Vibrio salinus]MCE0493921.1 glutathione S-transferase [Vibrio salinus]
MIYLHHLERSRADRIVWLLEELKLDYDIIHYKRDEKTSGSPESLKKVHPLGKSPVITDGELTVAESGAIIEYLIDTYDNENRLRPSEGQALLDYRYWLHFAEGSLMPLLVMWFVLNISLEKPIPFFIKPIIKKYVEAINRYFIAPRLQPQLALVDTHLSKNDWFAGDSLSGADIQMVLALQFAKSRTDMSPFTAITRYLDKIEKMDTYIQSVEKS